MQSYLIFHLVQLFLILSTQCTLTPHKFTVKVKYSITMNVNNQNIQMSRGSTLHLTLSQNPMNDIDGRVTQEAGGEGPGYQSYGLNN